MHIKDTKTNTNTKAKSIDNQCVSSSKRSQFCKKASYLKSISFLILQKYDYFWNLPKISERICVFHTKNKPVELERKHPN